MAVGVFLPDAAHLTGAYLTGYDREMDAGRNLRAARVRAGLTQSRLAALTGTSQATISAYEGGHKEPSVTTLSRLLLAAGSRLTVQAASRPVHRLSAPRAARAGRTLVDVIALAEALPVRHDPVLRFPRLRTRPGGPA